MYHRSPTGPGKAPACSHMSIPAPSQGQLPAIDWAWLTVRNTPLASLGQPTHTLHPPTPGCVPSQCLVKINLIPAGTRAPDYKKQHLKIISSPLLPFYSLSDLSMIPQPH